MRNSHPLLKLGLVVAVAMALTYVVVGHVLPALRSAATSARSTSAPDVALSPRQMAGQRVIYSYTGLTPPPRLLSLIRNGEAAGVIFFGDNISSHAQIRAVIEKLEQRPRQPPATRCRRHCCS